MTPSLHVFLLYKFGVIAVGAFVVYLGYRLLLRGAFDNTSDLKLRWGERELTLSRAAPGSLFALFGAGVMVASLALSRFEQTQHIQHPPAHAQTAGDDLPRRAVIRTWARSTAPSAPLQTMEPLHSWLEAPGQDEDEDADADASDHPADLADHTETAETSGQD